MARSCPSSNDTPHVHKSSHGCTSQHARDPEPSNHRWESRQIAPQLQGLVKIAVKIQRGNHLYGDKGYGGHSNYQDCIDNGLDPVFPPKKNARSRSRGGPFLRTQRILEYQQIGHERWKVKYGYAKRCAVEQTYTYKKQLLGFTMRTKDPGNYS